ncbi:MAG: hypothetical protein LBC53_09215 [Spirochaetaceae bacterium]|jgi:hypothetical protein|nr:hypothetical protein [Spirochaetaceae bacterium]
MSRFKIFNNVGSLRPGHSMFDLSYEKKFTCDMGRLIPILCEEAVPGDLWKIGNEVVIRFQPMLSPILHEVNVYVHYFFVPYRLLWDDWEDFITGGEDGDFNVPLPRWSPIYNQIGSLWDYFGFPTGVSPDELHRPLDFPLRAYNFVWNEYYRDENIMPEIVNLYTESNLDLPANLGGPSLGLHFRCWEKDYFTSALPWQQRGTAPGLPLYTLPSNAEYTSFSGSHPSSFTGSSASMLEYYNEPFIGLIGATSLANANILTTFFKGNGTSADINFQNNVKAGFSNNTVDLANHVLAGFNIADLRLAFQLQKWLERNARAGARYTEFLLSHFGVAPRDERLDRPEYIGGSRSPCIISEVLQTSASSAGSTPQGNMSGHGIVVDKRFVAKYRVQEFGLILGLMSVMPRSAYQQGIDRQWLRRTKFDFPFPEFVNLSEQAVERAEIYLADNEASNSAVFGYQGRFDELRIKRDMVCGLMRDPSFSTWHLGRIFSSSPNLNADFLRCVPDKRIFQVPTQPGLIVSFGNVINAFRPIPYIAEPGLIDHH